MYSWNCLFTTFGPRNSNKLYFIKKRFNTIFMHQDFIWNSRNSYAQKRLYVFLIYLKIRVREKKSEVIFEIRSNKWYVSFANPLLKLLTAQHSCSAISQSFDFFSFSWTLPHIYCTLISLKRLLQNLIAPLRDNIYDVNSLFFFFLHWPAHTCVIQL